MTATQVIITDGSEQDYESGDEQHVYYVCAADDDGDATGMTVEFGSEQAAREYGQQWARRLNVGLSWE